MKTFLVSMLCAVFVASCVVHETELYGIGRTKTSAAFGDGAASNSILGDTLTYKNSTATKILANMFVQLVGAYVAADALAVRSITERMATAGAQKAQIAAAKIAAQTEAAKITAGENATGVQAGLFKVGETIFQQK